MATTSFLTYLQRPRELPVPEFRAPPPSPVTGVLTSSSSGSSGYGEHPDSNEDDEIGRFLRCSARVPVLRLPERAVPRKKKAWAPPVIDVRLLVLPEAGGPVAEALRSAAVAFGCFQVIGHGVDRNLVSAALRHVAARATTPGPEEMEINGGDEDGEEMWWGPGGEQKMAGNWALQSGGSHFRNTTDALFTQLEQTATKIMDTLRRDGAVATATESVAGANRNDSLLCIRKHRCKHGDRGLGGPISHDDILRMLVRSSRCSRALALHLCPGASAFNVFSQRGLSRFRPLDGAVVVTVGDQLQAWNGGLYKSVAGKPAYSNDNLRGDGGDVVASAEYFHCFPSAGTASEGFDVDAGKIIPLNLQFMVAACLVLGYHFLMSCLHAAW
uniref:Non-haem dioxygenase N-terminal domain-containing protein n=1 Tax=Oryza brachyantha TaxID=4533 RepID=J3L3Z4_ORYBR